MHVEENWEKTNISHRGAWIYPDISGYNVIARSSIVCPIAGGGGSGWGGVLSSYLKMSAETHLNTLCM